jgi:mono/diheme cytochrome c family protein
VGILAVMLVLGAINNRVFTPWFAAAGRNAQVSPEALLGVVRRLRRTIAGEVALGVAVLTATGVLTSAEPAREVWARAPKPIDVISTADDLQVRLAIEPGRVGDNTYTITIRDSAGRAPSDVQRVQLRFGYVDQALGRGTRIAESTGAGIYQSTASDLSIAGRWQVDVAVRRANREDSIGAFLIDLGASTDPNRGAAIALPSLRSPYAPFALAALIASALGLVWSWLRRDLRRAQRGVVAGCAAVALLSAVLIISSADFSPDLLALRNPIPMTTETLARGREIYFSHGCADCHGDAGRGDGPLGVALRPQPADFRVHMAAGHTDGQIFDWLSNGFPGTAMRGYRSELSVDERWLVIDFIRSFASSEG